jgi:hypothetical protein
MKYTFNTPKSLLLDGINPPKCSLCVEFKCCGTFLKRNIVSFFVFTEFTVLLREMLLEIYFLIAYMQFSFITPNSK